MVAEDSFLCACGYEFIDAGNSRRTSKFSPGCLGCLSVFAIFVVILIVWVVLRQNEPHSRKSHPVEITILDESQRPVANAVLAYSEFEVVPIIPLMPFGPAGTIHNEKSVTTNSEGRAHIEVKFYETTAHTVTRAGANLEIVYSETTDSYDGKTRRSFPKQLPQWGVGHGFPERHWESTIIVRP